MEDSLLNLINSNSCKCELLGEGFISKSYKLEINSKNYIILQGQIEDSYNCYSQSYNNLIFLYNNGNPLIKSLKIPINDINLINPSQKNSFFKYGGLVYLEIQGFIFYEKYFDKVNIDNITDTISLFFKELYSIPINKDDIIKVKNNKISEFKSDIQAIKNYFKDKNINELITFEKEYLDYLNNFQDYHYIHGDLWEENMIISKDLKNLVGLVDFDNFGINDMAKDYASLLDFGIEFIYILIEKTKDIIKNKNDFMKRIKIYEKLIEIEDFAYVLKNNIESKFESKLKNLKKLNLV